METIYVTLSKNTTNTPVREYIIDFDIIYSYGQFDKIKECINRFLIEKVGITTKVDCGINQASLNDELCYAGCKKLVVYVSRLTIGVAELIKQCMFNGVHLTLMYCDTNTENYFEQVIC